MTAEVCKPLRRLKSVNAAWTSNRLYQEIYERARSLIKEDICMKYYDVRKFLYLETDVSRVGLGATLLQIRDNLSCGYDGAPDNAMLQPTAFASKNLSSTEQWYSNIKRGNTQDPA